MTARKSERLLNLLITLLVSRTYVTKERLRAVVEPYREAGDEAFEKMFERDKEELRSGSTPAWPPPRPTRWSSSRRPGSPWTARCSTSSSRS